MADTYFSSEFHHSIYIEYISLVYTLNLGVLILNYYLVRVRYLFFPLILIICLLWKQISDSFQSWKDIPKHLKLVWKNTRDENEGGANSRRNLGWGTLHFARPFSQVRKEKVMGDLPCIKRKFCQIWKTMAYPTNILNINNFYNQNI